MKIRSPIIAFVGHVDHGKSSILDKIRGTAVVKGEAGGITQCISCSKLDLSVVKKITGKLLDKLGFNINLSGLLFLDTPGHAAFTNLRKRGGNLADLAVLVVDINEGIKPQTKEAIEILKEYKTPFVVALNKIDLFPGWQTNKDKNLIESLKLQNEKVMQKFDERMYTILGELYELNIKTERFDRISDYTKQIALIPCSAKTGEGIPEILMILTGLAQKYLEEQLRIEVKGPGHGTILEVTEEKGIGTTLDLILYDGTLKVNDQIVIGSLDEPIVTKVRALFQKEKSKLIPIKEAHAAVGVKVGAPGLDKVLAGMPLKVVDVDLEEAKREIQKEVEEVTLDVDKEGIIVKADSLGSLEALIRLLREKGQKIKHASIGNISKKDSSEALAEEDPLNMVVVGFNVRDESDKKVKVITNNVIYRLLEDFEKWKAEELKNQESKILEKLVRPAELYFLPQFVFRQSNPAIFGVEIIAGKIKVGIPLMINGKDVGRIKEIQHEKVNVQEAEKGKQVAIAVPGATIGRQIKEGDTLYSDIPEPDFVHLKQLKKYLNREEVEVLRKIAEIRRKTNPVWGV
ncbi:MAG: translation initiation factor IF-2 [Candidatus Nanoarchaeia archaeon]|nr:translation initiation factor IF-2 [Candidatus Nanoarchaeia archaeon]